MPHIITQLEFNDSFSDKHDRKFDDYREIIDFYLKVFKHRIEKSTSKQIRDKVVNRESKFQLFEIASPTFFEYQYYQKVLEWYIRLHVLNDILIELFQFHDISISILQESTHISKYHQSLAYSFKYDISTFEDMYPFEFIVERNGERIGYRYLPFQPYYSEEKKEALLSTYELNKIVVINWKSEEILNKEQDNVQFISLKRVFEKYFSDEEYEYYVAECKEAIIEANSIIGFQAIPQMNSSYVSDFRVNVINQLSQKDYHLLRFYAKDGTVLCDDITPDDYKILDNNYLSRNLFKALLGNEDFAKSFVTSEYLYQIFKSGEMFDFTSVITGYLKSIEQLAYKVMKCSLTYCTGNSIYIKRKNMKHYPRFVKAASVTNAITNQKMVPFENRYENYFDITMAPLVWFMHDNQYCWQVSQQGRESIHKCLLEFTKDCRNEHFHKDNIYTYEEVNRIRNNAILCLYLLIGGCKYSATGNEDFDNLGIMDDEFDRLYNSLLEISIGLHNFKIKTKEGIEYKVIRLLQKKPKYTPECLIDSEIVFYIVDEYPSNEERMQIRRQKAYPKDKILVVNRENIPDEMYLYIHKRFDRIIW